MISVPSCVVHYVCSARAVTSAVDSAAVSGRGHSGTAAGWEEASCFLHCFLTLTFAVRIPKTNAGSTIPLQFVLDRLETSDARRAIKAIGFVALTPPPPHSRRWKIPS